MSGATDLAAGEPIAGPEPERPDRSLVPGSVARMLPGLSALTAVWVAAWAAAVWHVNRTPEPFRRFDHRLVRSGTEIHRIAEQLARLGDASRFFAILAVVVVICAGGRSWRPLVGALASLGVVLLVVEVILKPLVAARLHPSDAGAYPSGHTATACCLATVAIVILGRRHGPLRFPVPVAVRAVIIVLGVAIGPAVGVAMIVVGAHSIVDVLGALPLGVVLTLWTCRAVDVVSSPRRARP